MTFALLFPGQGSQYIGMCKRLIKEFPVAATTFDEANAALGFDLRSLVVAGNLETLTQSENAQPAVVAASYALYQVFAQQIDTQPFCAVGHSLGEISALIAAGALSFADGIIFAKKRGQLMHRALEEKKGRAGIVVDLDCETLTQIIATISPYDYVTISGYNSPRQFIVAGHQSALSTLGKAVDAKGGDFIPFRMMPMKADAPYHSTLMTFIQPEIEDALQGIQFKQPKFDVWSTVTGKVIHSTDNLRDILRNQLILPVCWSQVLEEIGRLGVELFIDIGPNVIMRNLVKENPALSASFAFDDVEDLQTINQYFVRG